MGDEEEDWCGAGTWQLEEGGEDLVDAGVVPGAALEEGDVGARVVSLYPVTVTGSEVATASLEYHYVTYDGSKT